MSVAGFAVGMNTTTSVRLPEPLRQRVKARALLERRSFSNTLRVLVEAGLAAPAASAAFADVDSDEFERLSAHLAAKHEAQR